MTQPSLKQEISEATLRTPRIHPWGEANWYENPEFQARYPTRRERMTFDAGVKAASIAEHRAESGFYEGGELLVMVDDSEGGRTARRVPVPENVGADGRRTAG